MLIFIQETQLEYFDPDDPDVQDIHTLGHLIHVLQTYYIPTIITLGIIGQYHFGWKDGLCITSKNKILTIFYFL